MINLNSKYKPLFNNNSRFFILTGGRGSAKSFGVGTFSTLLSFEENHRILITRQTMTSAHLSIIPEFQEKIELMESEQCFKVNKTDISNLESGSDILFRGIKASSGDNTANLKSLQGITTWIVDEAEELTDEENFDKIQRSVRSNKQQNRIILILNPATKEHWIYKRFFEQAGVKEGFNGVKGNTTYIHTTYLDNIEHLPKDFIEDLELLKVNNIKKYNHQILGGWKDKADGVVIENWKYGEFNPDNLQTSFGQDFGFTIDPTTLVEVAIDKRKKIIYVKECLHKKRMTTSDIYNANDNSAGKKLIVADSAEPRLIDELKRMGNNIKATKKGAGSISAGIMLIQDYQIIVEESSTNIAKEFNNYVYADKKSKLYVDDWNHLIDAIRYNVYYHLGKRFTPPIAR